MSKAMNKSSVIDLSASTPDEEVPRPSKKRRRRHAIDLTQSQAEETIDVDEAPASSRMEQRWPEGLGGMTTSEPPCEPPHRGAPTPLPRFRPPSRTPYQSFLHENISSSTGQQPLSSSRRQEEDHEGDKNGPSSSFAFLGQNLNGTSSSRRGSRRPHQPPLPPSSAADELLAKRIQEDEDASLAASLARSFDSEDNRRMRERMDSMEALEEIDEEGSGSMMRQLSERAQALLEAGRRRGLDRETREMGRGMSHEMGRGMSHEMGRGMSFFSSMIEGMLPGMRFEDLDHRSRRRGGGRDRGGEGGSRRVRHVPASYGQMAQLAASGIPPSLLFSNRDFTPEDYEMLQRLDSTVENRNGASLQEIDQLPTVVAAGGGGEGEAGSELSCCICLDEIMPGSHLRILPCLHKDFHQTCVDKWLVEKSVCPVCQSSVKI